jgi:hypothetical protein
VVSTDPPDPLTQLRNALVSITPPAAVRQAHAALGTAHAALEHARVAQVAAIDRYHSHERDRDPRPVQAATAAYDKATSTVRDTRAVYRRAVDAWAPTLYGELAVYRSAAAAQIVEALDEAIGPALAAIAACDDVATRQALEPEPRLVRHDLVTLRASAARIARCR